MKLGRDQSRLYAHICAVSNSKEACADLVKEIDLQGWAKAHRWTRSRLSSCLEQLLNLDIIKGSPDGGFRQKLS